MDHESMLKYFINDSQSDFFLDSIILWSYVSSCCNTFCSPWNEEFAGDMDYKETPRQKYMAITWKLQVNYL